MWVLYLSSFTMEENRLNNVFYISQWVNRDKDQGRHDLKAFALQDEPKRSNLPPIIGIQCPRYEFRLEFTWHPQHRFFEEPVSWASPADICLNKARAVDLSLVRGGTLRMFLAVSFPGMQLMASSLKFHDLASNHGPAAGNLHSLRKLAPTWKKRVRHGLWNMRI